MHTFLHDQISQKKKDISTSETHFSYTFFLDIARPGSPSLSNSSRFYLSYLTFSFQTVFFLLHSTTGAPSGCNFAIGRHKALFFIYKQERSGPFCSDWILRVGLPQSRDTFIGFQEKRSYLPMCMLIFEKMRV